VSLTGTCGGGGVSGVCHDSCVRGMDCSGGNTRYGVVDDVVSTAVRTGLCGKSGTDVNIGLVGVPGRDDVDVHVGVTTAGDDIDATAVSVVRGEGMDDGVDDIGV
jgi:hypothetical protein